MKIRQWIFYLPLLALFTITNYSLTAQITTSLNKIDIDIIHHIHIGEYNKAKSKLDSLLSEHLQDHYYQSLFKSRLGLYYTIKGNHDSALFILLPLYKQQANQSNLELLGDIASYIGRAYQHLNDNKNAFIYYNNSIQLHKKNNFKNYLGASNCFLAYFLLKCNMLDLAHETVVQGMSFAKKDTNSTEFAALKMALLHIKVRENINNIQFDSALLLLTSIRDILNTNSNIQDEVIYDLNKGDIALKKTAYIEALNYYQSALSKAENYFLSDEEARATFGIANTLQYLNKHQDAIDRLSNLLNQQKQYPLFITTPLYKLLSELYAQIGNRNKSSKYLDEYLKSMTLLHNNEIGIFIIHSEILKNAYESELLTKENLLINHQLEKQKLLKFGLFIISMLFFILFLVIFFAYKSRKKNIRLLTQKKAKLEILNKHIKLKNKSLSLINTKLSEANESLENFAYAAAHDLKGPLTGIFTYLQLIIRKYNQDESVPDYIKMYTDKSYTEAQRLNTLIQDLLALSTIDKNLGSPSVIHINHIIQRVIENHTDLISQNKAQISFDTLPTILAHPNMIESLFQNIIINAIKYKQPTIHPVVKIESVILEETMQFKIIDNGMGIEQEQINEIFKPFKRIAIDIDGSGLGLNTCKKIVDYYNGTISIVSTVNKGSCFIIDFPLNILNIT
ncbi:MAG: hypothetical protein IPH46_02050 [Bacteroidetes bacterium]|nr:hypothetical protein [Bacteroidota bacterium]